MIDPGGDEERIAGLLEEKGLALQAIIHTHTHIDHVGATGGLQERFGARACIHEDDRFLYDLLPVQSARLGIPLPKVAQMDGDLLDDTTIQAGKAGVQVIHTPGHTPGSVCFYLEFGGEKLVFTGDTLFRRGVGRTDLWGIDHETLVHSVKHKLLNLDEETIVVPGHGPSSRIGEEKRMNPYLR